MQYEPGDSCNYAGWECSDCGNSLEDKKDWRFGLETVPANEGPSDADMGL